MFHAKEKGFKAAKKKNHPSSEMPPFLLALAKVSRVRKKERKIYRGIKNANRGLRFFASVVVVVTNPKENKREDAQKLKALWWSVQKAPRAAAQNLSLSFLRFRPPKAEAAIL